MPRDYSMAIKLFGQDLWYGMSIILALSKHIIGLTKLSVKTEHKPPANNSIIAPLASVDYSTSNVVFSPIIIKNKLLEYELGAFIADC
eukprot:6183680-Pleurochrysis_carterae.AAC.3